MTTGSLPGHGDVIARHEILEVVGEGAAGVVFAARDPLGRPVALKILRPEKAEDPEAVRAFENEAEATGSVEHENVVTVLGWGEEDGFHFILMEYVDGRHLDERLKDEGRLEWQEAVEIILQVARALHHAHQKGLVHRDVKPENVLLYKDGRARLTDFGIVKDISSLKGFLVKGRQVGTAAYASPEQCLGKRLDAATDMYSLGATLYTAVCGRHPFTGKGRSEIMKKHVQAPLVSPVEIVPDLPKPLSNAIEKMMAKKQTDRYESMAQLIKDLKLIHSGKVAIADGKRVNPEALMGLKSGRKSRVSARHSGPPPRFPPGLILVVVLVALVLGVAALLFLG